MHISIDVVCTPMFGVEIHGSILDKRDNGNICTRADGSGLLDDIWRTAI